MSDAICLEKINHKLITKKAHGLDLVLFGIHVLMAMIKVMLMIHFQLSRCSWDENYRYN